jgi:hypothetical protein
MQFKDVDHQGCGENKKKWVILKINPKASDPSNWETSSLRVVHVVKKGFSPLAIGFGRERLIEFSVLVF